MILAAGGVLVRSALAYLEGLSPPSPTVVEGIRLGMTADQIRDARGSGDWISAIDHSGDLVLERDGDRFELHAGVLVAMTMRVPSNAPSARGPARVFTSVAVLTRTAADPAGVVTIRVVARDCPTHAQEVRSLLGRERP